MTSYTTSAATSKFNLSGNATLDPLLNEYRDKWSGSAGAGTALSFSFPWINGNTALWQTNYSTDNEQIAATHFGFKATQMAAARAALQSWANVANLSFTEVAETGSNVGDFRFAFSSALPASTWGWSSYPDNHWANAADVWVNSSNGSDLDWSAGSTNFQSLMHEIGHGLGLKHPGNYNGSGLGAPPFIAPALDFSNFTLMAYNDPNSWYWDAVHRKSISVYAQTPMVYDVQAIQYLYGANQNYRTGNDSYTFSPTSPFYKTIWDAGGNDTIDVSNFSLACKISLVPGSYSSIAFAAPDSSWFNGTDDLSIAFNCIIENAIGGSGNDTLIGNDADNRLTGGAGNDTLNGGSGIDSAAWSSTSTNYQLTFVGGSWQVKDKVSSEGTDTLSNMEKLQFSNKAVNIESKAHGAYTDLPQSLYHFFIVAFNAAPGVTYMDQLAAAYRYGMTDLQIADVFTSKPQFTDVYPVSLSHADLASRLMTNVVKGSATVQANQAAVNDITAALDIGWSVGKVIYTVFGNLASKPLTDATWGPTSHQFQNEISVAKYYTEVMNQSSADLTLLRSVLYSVDPGSDVSSDAAVATLIGMALMA